MSFSPRQSVYFSLINSFFFLKNKVLFFKLFFIQIELNLSIMDPLLYLSSFLNQLSWLLTFFLMKFLSNMDIFSQLSQPFKNTFLSLIIKSLVFLNILNHQEINLVQINLILLSENLKNLINYLNPTDSQNFLDIKFLKTKFIQHFKVRKILLGTKLINFLLMKFSAFYKHLNNSYVYII